MEVEPSSSIVDERCKLCNEDQRRYMCPKCGVGYCSLECYKSTAHLECSELFYKQCVEEELQMQQCDSEMRQKTLDILQRIYKDDVEEDILNDILQEDSKDYEADLDSDDENIPSLEKRLENVNLDDADELWSALTGTERQEFEALIQNGQASKLLPSWNPWWSQSLNKKLVEDITEKEQNQTYINNCPNVLNVPALQSITKVSPFIKFNIVNTIYAYTYCVVYFNGDHKSSPLDTICIFLRICETMRVNRVFKDISSAIESVLLEITNCDALCGDQDIILATKEGGDAILNGPEEDKSFYVQASLSELHQLIEESKKKIFNHKSKLHYEFKSKFQCIIDLGSTEMSKKNLSLLQKKIEFYIAWLQSQTQAYNIYRETV